MATLNCSQYGSLNNPPLVFIHGFLGNQEDWEAVIAHFESRFFCLAVSLPGHGSPFSLNFTQALEQTLKKYNLKQAVLVGYSMGGRLALKAAEENPDLASIVVAISAHPGLRGETERLGRIGDELKWERLLKTLPLKDFLDKWYEQPLFTSLTERPELFTKLLERRVRHNPRAIATAMRLFNASRQPLAKQIPAHAFFVCGEEDLKYTELYRKLVPPAQMRILAKCGHALHLENPDACAQIIEQLVMEKIHVA